MAAKADDFEGWCIHHRLEIQADGTKMSLQELKDNGLYYNRPAEELVFMKVGEHMKLHNLGKHLSAEHRKKMSEALKGKQFSAEHRKKLSEALSGENHPMYGKHHSAKTLQKMSEAHSGEKNPLFGKHHSAETRRKMSAAKKGKHKSAEHRKKLSEAKKGSIFWNDGVSCKRSRECPGEGWKRGKLKASMANCKT